MLKIRLKRTGRRNNPSFRVIVTEKGRAAKTGKIIDNLGFYNPKLKEKEIDKEKAEKWLSSGAKPSGTVHNMLVDMGLLNAEKINVLPRKSPVIKEDPKASGDAGAGAEKAEEPKAEAADESGEEEAPSDSEPTEEEEKPEPQEEASPETDQEEPEASPEETEGSNEKPKEEEPQEESSEEKSE